MLRRAPRVAFLCNVDNTLFDNDGFEFDLAATLERGIGPASAAEYWRAHQVQRDERDCADFLGGLQRCGEIYGRDRRWLRAGGCC